MNEKQLKIYEVLKDLGTEEAVDVILNYHGTQLLSDDFYEELQKQGIIEEEGEEDEFSS